jgi:membrane protein YqaA with SNARE-associated domain
MASAAAFCPAGDTVNDDAVDLSRRELWLLALRWFGGLAVLFGVMIGLANLFRAPLETLGHAFVKSFGYGGMAFGTFIADGFHFPIPPQFYMLMAVSSGVSELAAFAAITLGSLLGGYAGYRVAGRLAGFEFVARRIEGAKKLAGRAFARFGYRSAVIASMLPIAYSVLCYLAGMHGLPPRVFAVLSLCRIPRLMLFFYLVRLGWSGP